MKTKLEELRKEIIKANPDIVELKVGLRFFWKSMLLESTGTYTIADIERYSSEEFIIMCVHSERVRRNRDVEDLAKFDERILTDKSFKIIGRDINWEDCLKTIALKGIMKKFICVVADNREAIVMTVGYDDFVWIPNKPLHLQSEPTINLLHDLICKK